VHGLRWRRSLTVRGGTSEEQGGARVRRAAMRDEEEGKRKPPMER
jgi:hypothetical protein